MPTKYYFSTIILSCLTQLFSVINANGEETSALTSGDAMIQVVSSEDNQYALSFLFKDNEIPTLHPDYPVYLEVREKPIVGKYHKYELLQDRLVCYAVVTTEKGSEFTVSDTYIAKGAGVFELQRKLEVTKAASIDSRFNSLFGFRVDENCTDLTTHEYFVPGVWYKANFIPDGHLPTTLPQKDDIYFYYREDRITLPLVMFRNPTSGMTISITHKDSDPQTVVADALGLLSNEDYQYGALGMKREDNILYTTFIYPGSEADTRSSKGPRSHPVKQGLQQQYNLEIVFAQTSDYAKAVNKTWEHAFELYNPKIYEVELPVAYDGLIETLLQYYIPSIDMGGEYDAPGFPYQVSLDSFKSMGPVYTMGFVGMQIATGYFLFREGMEKSNGDTQMKGAAVLDFWANNCLSDLGYPRTWYDPGKNGAQGKWRGGSDLHTTTGGMESLIAAWCFAKRNGIEKPQWIETCKRFGDWLVANQNADGSYYYSYNHGFTTTDGKHPSTNQNKFLTICAIRYLVELHIATGEPAYKEAALKAGEWCYKNIHQKYCYVACVVDNPQTIDGASGQKALFSFMSLYDLTKDPKWLEASEQAATYTESWVYSFEIPVEKDRTDDTCFPKDRSIVGQQLISVCHGGADLGFAWTSFAYYRLYLITGKEHYLHVARIAAHNTKQSMNWDGTLYPGQAHGLQLEAFGVTVPRRMNGVMTTLNWNYAAHLDPMVRFKDAFGTPDIEKVERMTWEERQYLNNIYSQVQSANYGQEVNRVRKMEASACQIYPNPVRKDEQLHITFPDSQMVTYKIECYSAKGQLVFSSKVKGELETKIDMQGMTPGVYILSVKEDNDNLVSSKRIVML